ncbi:MAG: cobalamin biosynthesis protein CbiM [Anaerolineales bacterium]|nr:cobalamin biosynthesis protein CbiM [Anaerolineales bacterium]
MWFSPVALHLPDGFLLTWISLVGWGLALFVIAASIRQTRAQLGERQIPLMGVLAAFIFAAQSINFPVAAGTSGHLLGGTLAAIVMGPWAATLVMTSVIAVQGFLFQDGGLLVMGWNILNTGVITAFVGYGVYMLVRRLTGNSSRSRLVAGSVGAWLSVQMGAIATAFELALSGTTPLRLGLPAMMSVHMLIGLGEALITVGAIALLQNTRPEVLEAGETAPGRRGAGLVVVGLFVAITLAFFSPLASPNPDGLEYVAKRQGFHGLSSNSIYEIMPHYTLPFVADAALTTVLAVALGTLIVFAFAWLVGRTSTRREASGD